MDSGITLVRHIVLTGLVGLLALPVFAQRQEAKEILDRMSAGFRKAGGVEVGFTVKIEAKGQTSGLLACNIRLKGEKFVLETMDAIIWFDGETQWSYLIGSNEVNISNPTKEELQGINPYALLSIYERGFACTLGKTRSWQGASVHEVILTAAEKKGEIAGLTLYVERGAYRPLYIRAELTNGSRSEITVTTYKGGLKLDDAIFVFDKNKYPRAEIIDLR
jgi:outer membrane lipoprotein-sorting protein